MFLLRNRYAMLAIAAAVLVGGVAYFRVYAGAVQESTPAAAMPAAAVDVAMVQSRRVTDWHDY